MATKKKEAAEAKPKHTHVTKLAMARDGEFLEPGTPLSFREDEDEHVADLIADGVIEEA